MRARCSLKKILRSTVCRMSENNTLEMHHTLAGLSQESVATYPGTQASILAKAESCTFLSRAHDSEPPFHHTPQ